MRTERLPVAQDRRVPRVYDREVYKERNLIERAFNKLKHWRMIAARYDRRSLYFMPTLQLAAAITWGT